MIKLEQVSFAYNSSEEYGGIHDVTLQVRPGECVVLCGASGCGKTTLLRLMSGLAPGQYSGQLTGTVLLGGKEPSRLTSEEKARNIGMVFQDPRSQFFMSNVREELAFTGENLGLEQEALCKLVLQQAELLGVTRMLDQSLRDLSSGQKQKTAIAASCLLSPPVLFLDEPTANLDAQTAEALVDILQRLKKQGTTIVISEHWLHSFLPVADRYVCLREGRIVRQWDSKQFAGLSGCEAAEYRLRHPDLVKRFAVQRQNAGTADLSYQLDCLGFRYRNSKMGCRNITAVVTGGTVTAVIGENGAGKTTLCKILCGLLRPQSGAVYKNGVRMNRTKLRKDSYFVMQDADYQLFCESVGNELVLGQKITDMLKERAYAAMDAFGITELKDRHPASLSGGEKQRVTLAAAFYSDADLIVLDEPTSGLDAENACRVADYALRLSAAGKAVVIITHDPLLIAVAGDHLIQV